MIQRHRDTPYNYGRWMAENGGTLRGLPFGPGPAQAAAIAGFSAALGDLKRPQPQVVQYLDPLEEASAPSE